MVNGELLASDFLYSVVVIVDRHVSHLLGHLLYLARFQDVFCQYALGLQWEPVDLLLHVFFGCSVILQVFRVHAEDGQVLVEELDVGKLDYVHDFVASIAA
jgi:hypothetical protein